MLEFKNQFPLSKKIVDSIPESEYENFALKCIELLPKILDQGAFTNEGTILEKQQIYERISNPVEQFINLYYEKDVNGMVALWQFFEKFSLFCEEKGYRKMTKSELKKIIGNLYEVDKKNIGGNCWVRIYGISEKKDLSGLSNLSTFPHDSLCIETSENTDKTDKTDNPVTGKPTISQQDLVRQIKALLVSHYGNGKPKNRNIVMEWYTKEVMYKFSLPEESARRYLKEVMDNLHW